MGRYGEYDPHTVEYQYQIYRAEKRPDAAAAGDAAAGMLAVNSNALPTQSRACGHNHRAGTATTATDGTTGGGDNTTEGVTPHAQRAGSVRQLEGGTPAIRVHASSASPGQNRPFRCALDGEQGVRPL